MKRLAAFSFSLSILLACSAPDPDGRLKDYLNDPEYPQADWPVSEPAEQGMDAEILARMPTEIQTLGYDIHGVLVVRHGVLVYERYGRCEYDEHQYLPNEPQPVYTMSHTVVSSLVGIAVRDGLIPSVDSRVLDWFPGLTLENPDSRKSSITIRQLLTMTPGFAWTWIEHDNIRQSADPVPFLFGRRLEADPGSVWRSNAACYLALGVLLERASGTNLTEYAESAFFGPLGISDYRWTRNEGGVVSTDSGLSLLPRDMAKIGQLYLSGGEWEGARILSEGWVDEATAASVMTPYGNGFGYNWWTLASIGGYSANGALGQNVYVLPGLDTVVVFTSEQNENLSSMALETLILHSVVPAVEQFGSSVEE